MGVRAVLIRYGRFTAIGHWARSPTGSDDVLSDDAVKLSADAPCQLADAERLV